MSSNTTPGSIQKVTVPSLTLMKEQKTPITMLTAYDTPFAKLVDGAGTDVILVGDSLGMVVLGYASTVPVTLEDMIRHTAAVVRGTKRALVVSDLPFGSYQASVEDAVRASVHLLKEGGAEAVKLEGGFEVVETVRKLSDNGIAVMGHLGLTPQRSSQLGGFKVQAKSGKAAAQLVKAALALEEAGAFAIVLEAVPSLVAKAITQRLAIPTIGIGAGPDCDGQVLVLHDVLGLYGEFTPKFAKRYVEIAPLVASGLASFVAEVRSNSFPDSSHSFTMSDRERVAFEDELEALPKVVGRD